MSIDSEELARRSVDILGPSSAAFKALAEMDRRRAEGQDVTVWLEHGWWLVGPRRGAVSEASAQSTDEDRKMNNNPSLSKPNQ